MGLSKRRLQFLKVLASMTAAKQDPVHYAEVGERLGVSKWTAYDMMRELVSDGFASVSYSTLSSGFRGRSQVLFDVTPEGRKLIDNTDECSSGRCGEWEQASVSLLKRVDAAIQQRAGLKSLLAQYGDAPATVFCAALLASLVVEFRRGGFRLMTLQAIMESGADATTVLFVLIGALAGELLGRGVLHLSADIDAMVQRFMDEISKMSSSRKRLLADFAEAVIDKAIKA